MTVDLPFPPAGTGFAEHRRMKRTTGNWITAGLATAAGAAVTALAVRAVVRRRRHFDLSGKAALVTGGSRGLGLVIARQLADAGARVAICARDGDELQRARADLATHAAAAEVLAIQYDVNDPEQVRQMVETVADRFGSLDVLVNNAATIQVGPAQHMTAEDYDTAMRTIFYSALHATLAAIPHMRRVGGGRVVNVASIGGKIATPHLLPYSAAKFALVGLGEGMRAEYLQENIYLSTVCPGLVTTGSPRNVPYKGRVAEEYAWFAASDAMPGVAASAERVARTVVRTVVNGDAEAIVPTNTKLAVLLHGIAPGVTAELMAVANRFLPKPGGQGERSAVGHAAAGLEPAFAAERNAAAGGRNNEVG